MTKVIRFKDNTYLDGTILESSSNSNGEYIKYSNGDLICKGIINVRYPDINVWYNTKKNFPCSFIAEPGISLGVREDGRGIDVNYLANSSRIIIYFRSDGHAGGSSNISYIAIGKWK